MESTRQKKFSRLIQRDLGEIFQQDIKGYFGNAFITVTRVEISPDLGVARVNLSVMMAEDPAKVIELVNDHKGDVRRILGNRIKNQVRVIPELVFIHDDGAAYASRMDEIISNLDIPPEKDEEEE